MLNDAKNKEVNAIQAAIAILDDPSLAYVKSVEIDGETAWAIHAFDGTQLAVLADREAAFGAAITNDYVPVSAH